MDGRCTIELISSSKFTIWVSLEELELVFSSISDPWGV
ncbi:hypothetical protein PAAL109150_22455 [Paenibacillus alkaliterrae]